MPSNIDKIKGLLLLISLLLCNVCTTYAQNAVLKNTKKSYAISYPLFLTDPENNLDARQVQHSTGFKPAEFPTLSLGTTTASVWIKTSVVNQSGKTDWYFQIDSPPVLQSVEVYHKQGYALVKIFSGTAAKAKTSGDVRLNNLLIPINIPVNTSAEYYIRASSNNILRIPLKVLTLQTAYEQGYLTDLFNGITFGMLMAFAIYNLFVYLLTKERSYLYYLGYIFFWSLNLFFYNGFLPDMLPSLVWLNSAGSIIAMASILSIFFTNSFLQTKKNSPFFYRIRGLMFSLSLVILLTDIFWKGAYAFMIIQYCMYPFFLYWFGAGIVSLRKGYQPALYFIIGFGCLMLGNALYNLKDLDILPDNIFTRSSMHWGTLLEALVLSFALASRLNFYRKQQELLQLKSIEEKRNFLKELLQRQEQEKKRVAMELHDNIGQQLILIKNRSWRLHQQVGHALQAPVMTAVAHIADIMAEVRSILHRLRPYQMDLLGLTQSLNGLVTETFPEAHIAETENIDPLFTADEAMHIFRIIQLLTDALQAGTATGKLIYSVHTSSGNVSFLFKTDTLQHPLGSLPDIYNRLELLNGNIAVQTRQYHTLIKVNIPYPG